MIPLSIEGKGELSLTDNQPNPSQYNVPFRVMDGFRGMPYRKLGNTGLRISNIGLGTWKMGFPETGDNSRIGKEKAFDILDRSAELGVTFWDTANRYNFASGNSERIIGQWLARNPQERRNIIVATKIFGGMDGSSPNHSGLSRSNIIDSVQASLDRMRIESIDLLYFHAYDDTVPIQESLAAIEDLIRQNVVRYFAVSNFTIGQLQAYGALDGQFSIRSRITAVQNRFDLLRGESPEQEGVLAYAAQTGLSYIAWSPLAGGLLSGKYLDMDRIGPGDRLFDEGGVDAEFIRRSGSKLRQMAELAEQSGMELSQLAIAYMLSIPGMGPVIASSGNLRQLESNAAAGKLKLDDRQRQRMEEILTI